MILELSFENILGINNAERGKSLISISGTSNIRRPNGGSRVSPKKPLVKDENFLSLVNVCIFEKKLQ